MAAPELPDALLNRELEPNPYQPPVSKASHRRAATSRPPAGEPLSEAEWQAQVIRLAISNGWQTHHHFDSRRSSPGWPDLALVHPTRCLFLLAEIKTETGRVKPEQEQWLAWLTAAGVDARLWRPSDWDEVVATLTGTELE